MLAEDNRKYNHKPPAWKQSTLDEEEKKAVDEKHPNQSDPRRQNHLSRFIMDKLAFQAKTLDGEFRKRVDDRYKNLKHPRKPDDALTAVYLDIVQRSQLPGGEGGSSRAG